MGKFDIKVGCSFSRTCWKGLTKKAVSVMTDRATKLRKVQECSQTIESSNEIDSQISRYIQQNSEFKPWAQRGS